MPEVAQVGAGIRHTGNDHLHVKRLVLRFVHADKFIERAGGTQVVLFPAGSTREQEIFFCSRTRRQESLRFIFRHRAVEHGDFQVHQFREERLDGSPAVFAHRDGAGHTFGHAGSESLVLGLVETLLPDFTVAHQGFQLLPQFLGKTDTRPAVLHFKRADAMPGEHEIIDLDVPLFFKRIKRRVESIDSVFVNNPLRCFFVNIEQRDILLLASFDNRWIQVFFAIVGAAQPEWA